MQLLNIATNSYKNLIHKCLLNCLLNFHQNASYIFYKTHKISLFNNFILYSVNSNFLNPALIHCNDNEINIFHMPCFLVNTISYICLNY